MSAKIAANGYVAELEGDTITCYRLHKQRGVLGLGKRKVEEPVLVIAHRGGQIEVPPESADRDFVALLASKIPSGT